MLNIFKKKDGLCPSKSSFICGLVAGFVLICVIGFFIFLGIFISNGWGDKSKSANNNFNVNQPVNTNQQPQPSAGDLAKNVKPVTSADHLLGSKNAKVTMIEFSDFQCPFCSRAHATLQKLVADYNGQVAWVYRHFPLDSLHPFARKAAEASECASEQNKFWEYADVLYANQQSFSESYFGQAAGDLGLNTEKFNSCLTSGKYAGKVNDNFQEGVNAGITGTPGIYINGQLIKGALPYENFKQIIDQALASK